MLMIVQSRPRSRWSAAAALVLFLVGAGLARAAMPAASASRWEPDIRAFEASDREQMPAPGGIVFIGSSSIRGWDVAKSFPGLPVINRGFGGSQIADSVEFADRIVIPYKPKTVVFYAGDNDINSGKTPQQVLRDYREFVAKVHGALPDGKIVFIAIKPSLRRWNLVGTMREANKLVREYSDSNAKLEFVDVDPPMLGSDGKPRPELFVEDGLHMTAEGYRVWTALVRPFLE
jgi:lysophospholipase L1-like esterase